MVSREGTDGLAVLLGTPNVESTRLYGMTVTEGDPSWAGPLAGVELRLPVYHITEAKIKAQIDTQVYEQQVGLAEMALEIDAIAQVLQQVRAGHGPGAQ